MRYYIPLLRISLIAPQRTPLDEVDLHSSDYSLHSRHYSLLFNRGIRNNAKLHSALAYQPEFATTHTLDEVDLHSSHYSLPYEVEAFLRCAAKTFTS